MAGTPPRPTLVWALERFGAEGVSDASAIDLGCGEGRDTVELLARGWRVTAIDGEAEAFCRLVKRPGVVPTDRLTMKLVRLEEASLERSVLVNASYSLPFVSPGAFGAVWARVRGAIEPGGRFCGQFFGERDSWAVLADRSHHRREEVERMLDGLRVEMLQEEERDTEDGGKHWHVFHVVARA